VASSVTNDAVSFLRRSRQTLAPIGIAVPILSISVKNTTPRWFGDKSNPSPSEMHSLYLEQMNEINADRDAIFGPSDPTLESQDISQLAKTYAEQTTTDDVNNPPEWNAEEAYAEREALFQFTSEEKSAWTNYSSTSSASQKMKMSQEKLMLIKEALAHREREEYTQQSLQFTHLSPHQDSVTMVDVGNKANTRRIAKARSVVTFPPEVMEAFVMKEKDMIGPKGPIFETARLAGIMGAK
jgi:hypothetical protein